MRAITILKALRKTVKRLENSIRNRRDRQLSFTQRNINEAIFNWDNMIGDIFRNIRKQNVILFPPTFQRRYFGG